MLPTAINDPSIADSWEQYNLFVNKYGSHVLTKVHLGARLQHFATTEATTTLITRQPSWLTFASTCHAKL